MAGTRRLLFQAMIGSPLGPALFLSHCCSRRPARSVSWTLLAVLIPLAFVVAGDVSLDVLGPELCVSVPGATLVLARVTVKLLTMTVLLVYTAYLAGENR